MLSHSRFWQEADTLRESTERAFGTLGTKTKELVNSAVATIPARRWKAGKGLPSGD